jgi:putative sterol carrier protein
VIPPTKPYQGDSMENEELADTLMETAKGKLNEMADSNKGLNKKLQICFTDIDKGYLLHIGEDGTVDQFDKNPLTEGKGAPADVSVYTTVDVISKLIKKELNPMMAMMQGKIRIDGDMGLITKLASIFM